MSRWWQSYWSWPDFGPGSPVLPLQTACTAWLPGWNHLHMATSWNIKWWHCNGKSFCMNGVHPSTHVDLFSRRASWRVWVSCKHEGGRPSPASLESSQRLVLKLRASYHSAGSASLLMSAYSVPDCSQRSACTHSGRLHRTARKAAKRQMEDGKCCASSSAHLQSQQAIS